MGDPPAGSEDLGECSQIAVFQHQGEPAATQQEDRSDQMPYSMVSLSCSMPRTYLVLDLMDKLV